MLQTTPQTASMHELKNHTDSLFKKFEHGPVLLLSRHTPKAIMVSPTQWDEIVLELKKLQLLAQANASIIAVERNETTLVTDDELTADINKKRETLVNVGN